MCCIICVRSIYFFRWFCTFRAHLNFQKMIGWLDIQLFCFYVNMPPSITSVDQERERWYHLAYPSKMKYYVPNLRNLILVNNNLSSLSIFSLFNSIPKNNPFCLVIHETLRKRLGLFLYVKCSIMSHTLFFFAWIARWILCW